MLRNSYINEGLQNLVTNRIETKKVIESNGELYQNDDPIYNDPIGTSFFSTHFYAPNKYFMGRKYDTFNTNIAVIWGISLITYIILYFDLIRYLLVFSVRGIKRLRRE